MAPPSVKDRSVRELDGMYADLIEHIERHTADDENVKTQVDGLYFFRRDSITEPCLCTTVPSILFVVQGAKQLLVGEESFVYDTEHFLMNSLDLPASSQVLLASPEKPSLGFMLILDFRLMAEIMIESQMPSPKTRSLEGSSAIGRVTPTLVEPFYRLITLLDEPEAIPALAPLIKREIHYRLLTSDLAERFWHIASVGSQSNRIVRAVNWLRSNFSKPLRIEDLANHVQMSPTTMNHHFRLLTSMSPLQYQKWLRLNDAKRLMLNENLDAATAAFRVGYESPSQFSREYGRMFGLSPKRHIDQLRQAGEGA
ncbi:AraC family transcriptional regulator [Oceanobacter kriegii]|uniref:AraC family transcriptional regulator n=1 Tax=Oceanobacter kriegii TaxID=64972 RepID=UPI0004182B00|nr:AraC family transcriptional regulator [Oceanobacter kriegii]